MGLAFTGILLGLLLVIGVALVALMIVKAWLVDGALDGGMAGGSLAALFILTGFIWHSQGTLWMFVGLLALLGGCVRLPLLGQRAEKSNLQRLRAADIAK